MSDKKSIFDEHYEDFRAKHALKFRFDDSIEFISDGEHSIEKYLARLEAKKKAAQAEKTES